MMANSRLILVEGIPGSGKTSTARFVRDWLEQHGQRTSLFLEGDWRHPADFESVACLDEREYAELRNQFPEQTSFLAEHALAVRGEWFFSYRQLQREYGNGVPDALFEALAKFEVYSLPAQKYQRLLRQRWQDFSAEARARDTVYVFECCFLQNPTTTLLAYHNFPLDAVQEYIGTLADIIRPLAPRLVYLEQTNIPATLESIRRQRPPAWVDFVTRYLTEQAYGAQHGLHGFAGVIDFYTIRQALELELIQALPIPSLLVSDVMDWEARHQYLAAFLEMQLEKKPLAPVP
jgi:hypothetical protein